MDHAIIGSILIFPLAQKRISLDILNVIVLAGVIVAAYCCHVEEFNVILKAHPEKAVVRIPSKKLANLLFVLDL